jgi:hypothetical protein
VVLGTLHGEGRAAVALAEAAVAAASRAPLSRTGLEPVYLSGNASVAAEPRV